MCPDLPRGLRLAALGLILPAAMAGPAAAQSPGWVDPPAKSAPAETAPANTVPAETAPAGADAAAATAPASPKPEAPAVQARDAARPAVTETGRPGGATAGLSRRAERPRVRGRAVRRPTETPAMVTAPRAQEAPRVVQEAPRGASDPRFPEWAGRAQALAGDYLAAFSAPNGAMVAEAPRFYGQRLRFHGRITTLAALLAEKRRFAQRWPERRYAARTSRTACNAALERCIVRAIVDFRAGNPARGALSRGVAELVLEVSFSGGRPVIVSESSRVLRRGAAVGALAGGNANG